MPIVALLGAQWGDEGKGKIAGRLAQLHGDAIACRYSAGPNAGHLIFHAGTQHVFRILPAASLYAREIILGPGLHVDLDILIQELQALRQVRPDCLDLLHISDRAHLIRSQHIAEDRLLSGGKIGTTGSGTGPCIRDKVTRVGTRTEILTQPRRTLENFVALESGKTGDFIDALANRVCDITKLIRERLMAGRVLIAEGSQGALLDIDHGQYPFVTSCHTTIGGVLTGLGVGPRDVVQSWIVASVYLTKVGGGPFPTRIEGPLAAQLQNGQQEVDGATNKLRHVGWLDLDHLKFARTINQADGVFLTRVDILNTLPYFMVYSERLGFKRFSSEGDHCEISALISSIDELASHVRRFVAWLQTALDIPVVGISYGRETDHLLLLKKWP